MTIRLTKRALAALAFAGAIGAALPALAAGVDYLLTIDGVPGESKVETTFDPPMRGGCTGPVAGGAAMMNIKNPELVRVIPATGRHFRKAVLFVRKSGVDATGYEIKLEDILITSIAGAAPGQAKVTFVRGTWTKQGCR